MTARASSKLEDPRAQLYQQLALDRAADLRA